jgi:hypothetical protein
MQRENVNLFFSRLFILVPESPHSRAKIIEIAAESEDVFDFLRDWLWTVGAGMDHILELKLAFGWTYAELGKLFGLSPREIGQQIRSKRLRSLGAYPRVDQGDFSVEQGGLSCFMLEQHLSQWLDCEWEDLGLLPKIKDHLRLCPACKHRLKEYRRIHENLLAQFLPVAPIEAEEWEQVLSVAQRNKRIKILKWAAILAGLVGLLIIFIWIIRQQPETMPNIYEIPESL